MSEYTPTERLRDVITDYADDFLKPDHQRMTRWPEVEEALDAHDRAIKAEAWEDAYNTGVSDAWTSMDYDGGITPAARVNPYRSDQ